MAVGDSEGTGTHVLREVEWAIFDAIVADDDAALRRHLPETGGANVVLDGLGSGNIQKVPKMLREKCPAVLIAAFMGSVKCFRVFVALAFDEKATSGWGSTIAHFACAGGDFEICREVDGLGVDWLARDMWWERGDLSGHFPAEYAAMFGRIDVLRWLWAKGFLLDKEGVGWIQFGGGDDASIVMWAAK
jgi:hypothetical protein